VAIIIYETSEGPVPFEAPTRAGVSPASAGSGVATVSQERLEDALQLVGRVARSLETSLGSMKFAKAEATIAVKLSAEGSFIVAKTAAEASISVTISLSKDDA